ncbi:MAG: hypothetical protein Q7T74_03090, partial [Candidatus Saccharibacteria bacterium]|nr:hypothetical protein [Candidatus Saccharibacteria bacterium]
MEKLGYQPGQEPARGPIDRMTNIAKGMLLAGILAVPVINSPEVRAQSPEIERPPYRRGEAYGFGKFDNPNTPRVESDWCFYSAPIAGYGNKMMQVKLAELLPNEPAVHDKSGKLFKDAEIRAMYDQTVSIEGMEGILSVDTFGWKFGSGNGYTV